MSVQQADYTIAEDVGRGFRLTRELTLWRDYSYPEREEQRGESQLAQGPPRERGARFEILRRVKTTPSFPLEGREVSYEVLLVLFDEDRARIKRYEDTEPVVIDEHYLGRLDAFPVFDGTMAKLRAAIGSEFAGIVAFENWLRPDAELWWLREWLLLSTRTGYVWRIYGDTVYAGPEVPDLAAADEEPGSEIEPPRSHSVLTLQLWLAMLGRDPGPRDGQLHSATRTAVAAFQVEHHIREPAGVVAGRRTFYRLEDELRKRLPPDPAAVAAPALPRQANYTSDAAYWQAVSEGLRQHGIPLEPETVAAAVPELSVSVPHEGATVVSHLPPGSYRVEVDAARGVGGRGALWGSARIALVSTSGEPVEGVVRLLGDDSELTAVVGDDGVATFTHVVPGIYEVAIAETGRGDERGESEAGVPFEVRLVDHQGSPVAANLFVAPELSAPRHLADALRLFKALTRRVSPRDLRDRIPFSRVLSPDLDESTFLAEAWADPRETWGAFYGAPWLGIVFDPGDGVDPRTCQWTSHSMSQALLAWGRRYLNSAHDSEEISDRLRHPIVILSLASPLARVGGEAGEPLGSVALAPPESAGFARHLASWDGGEGELLVRVLDQQLADDLRRKRA